MVDQQDEEFILAIKEAHQWGLGDSLRKLFVSMLLSDSMNRPDHVWRNSWKLLSKGILYDQRRLTQNSDLILTDHELKNFALIQIEDHLQSNRKSLKDFKSMPCPNNYPRDFYDNKLIYNESNYDPLIQEEIFRQLFVSLTDEQGMIYENIMKAVANQQGGVFFIYGQAGTGKTHVLNTLAATLRSKGDIVLTVATSGVAALFLQAGKTAHLEFKIPIPTLQSSVCNIEEGTEIAELLKETKLIIWDEAPMAHKYCFDALDKSLRDIMSVKGKSSKLTFGGKVVVLGGDFRQIVPVVPNANRSSIINSTIKSSNVWNHCKVFKLTQNMRLSNEHSQNLQETENFCEWILRVGDGNIGEENDGHSNIEIPHELLITDFADPTQAIVHSTYPDIIKKFQDADFFKDRAILVTTNQTVDNINNYILDLLPGEEKEYFSSDFIDHSEADEKSIFEQHTAEFLNCLQTSGLPNHSIKLKLGTPIVLLKNLDQAEGLCNGTRLIVTRLADHVIEAKIITGINTGNKVYIPRISLSSSQSPCPFKLVRRQFPISLSFAMVIDKSQGQSFDHVGLYLPNDVYSHGQLYLALSRVRRKEGLKILIHDKFKRMTCNTTNVVFREII